MNQTFSTTALVLLSGGQDSTTCLFWARKEFTGVRAIGFDYGQKHKVELDFARDICTDFHIPYTIIPLSNVFGRSSLTHGGDHEPHEEGALPQSFVPARNAVFLTLAAAQACQWNITDIVIGVSEVDYSGYPDCREEFIRMQEKTLSLALDSPLHIHCPLLNLTKAQTWQLARMLSDDTTDVVEIIRSRTITDYNATMTLHEWGRGALDNQASILRERGWREAKQKGWI